jgi:hypothetical protein
MLYATQGLGDIFTFGNSGGHNHVHPNGTNVWQPGEKQESNHHYLRLKISPSAAGEALDQLFLQGARRNRETSLIAGERPMLITLNNIFGPLRPPQGL